MKKTLTIFKILVLILFNYFIFYVGNPFVLTCILVLFVVMGLFTNFSLMKRLKSIVPVAIMIILFQIIFNSTVPITSRVFLGYMAAIRLIAISLSVLLFLTITSINELLEVFSFLPKNLLLIILMTSYFIPQVLTESEKIASVQKSRGMNINNVRIIYNIASLIVPLIHRVLQRAETLSMTIVSRGYEES